MSNLLKRIESDLVVAVKRGDSLTRDTLRMLKAAIKNMEIGKLGKMDDSDAITLLRKEIKSRQEAADHYTRAGRTEQAAKEEKEKNLISLYLPADISDAELEQIVVNAIQAVGANSTADLGKIMSAVMLKVRGKADGGRVSQMVRSKLS